MSMGGESRLLRVAERGLAGYPIRLKGFLWNESEEKWALPTYYLRFTSLSLSLLILQTNIELMSDTEKRKT